MPLTQTGPPVVEHHATDAVVPVGPVTVGKLGSVRPIVVGAARVSEPSAQPLVFVNFPVIAAPVLFWLNVAGAMTRSTWHPVPVPTNRVDSWFCSWNGCENAFPAKVCGLHGAHNVGFPES